MNKNSQKNILIVEDEKTLSATIGNILRREGYGVEVAENGLEGLDKALELHPDLIILDIIMPRMDGITMLKKLREDKWGKKAKVIIYTNLEDQRAVREAHENRVIEFLIKIDTSLRELLHSVNSSTKNGLNTNGA